MQQDHSAMDLCIIKIGQKYETVFAAKVSGTLGLLLSLKDIEYDALIFCSSIAALFGPPGQSNHAAANSFLDSVCYYLRSQQNSVYTINWGAWSKDWLCSTPWCR